MRPSRSPRCLPLVALLIGACAGPGGKAGDDTSPATGGDGPGGDGDGGGGGGAPAPTWHGDVAPIFARSCDGCHAPGGVGSPTWSGPDEAAAWAPAIAVAVGSRAMPPWQASPGCAEYTGDFSLTDEEVEQVVAWAEAGGPVGDPASAAPLPEPFRPATLDRVDVELRLPEPYTPRADAGPDDYRCFLMELPFDEDVWVTGYEMLPGNTSAVHHIIPFLIDPDDVATYEAMDAADPGPGYLCYGGPGGDIDSLLRTRWLGSWAPGSGASVLPEGTGIRVRPGGRVAFQVHYNLAAADGAADQSGLALQIERERQGWAELQPWTDVQWVLGVGMEIPPGSTGTTHTFRYTAGPGDDFSFRTASLHMHQLGQRAHMKVQRADGSEDCLLDIGAYDFNWQREYSLVDPVPVRPGDTIELSCTWDNPTDETVRWGEGTGDEMCLGIALITD
jgi:hypothetical protein